MQLKTFKILQSTGKLCKLYEKHLVVATKRLLQITLTDC